MSDLTLRPDDVEIVLNEWGRLIAYRIHRFPHFARGGHIGKEGIAPLHNDCVMPPSERTPDAFVWRCPDHGILRPPSSRCNECGKVRHQVPVYFEATIESLREALRELHALLEAGEVNNALHALDAFLIRDGSHPLSRAALREERDTPAP